MYCRKVLLLCICHIRQMQKAMDALDMEEFSRLVFEMVCLIPRGRATSYGAIAHAIGYPARSRMVGWVLAGCGGKGIPAHRVVNSQGVLSGREAFETPAMMQELLVSEGVVVENNRIRNWREIRWDPVVELGFD